MKNSVVPRYIEEGEYLLEPGGGVQHQLFIIDYHAPGRTDFDTFIIHDGYGIIPSGHALSIVGQVETSDGHLKIYHIEIIFPR